MANLSTEELQMLISKDNAKEKSLATKAGEATGGAIRTGLETTGEAVKSQVEPVAKGLGDFFKGLFADPKTPEQVMAQSMLPAFQEAAPDAARTLAQNPQAFFGVYHHLAGMAGPTINQQVAVQGGPQESGYDNQGNYTPPESIMSLPQGLLSDTTGELADSEAQKSSEGIQKAENVMNKAQSRAAEFGAKPEKGIMEHISGAIGRVFGTPGSTAATEAARTMGGMPASVATVGYAGQMPLTTYEQAQLGQQAQFKQAEQYGAATERMTNLLKATQPYSFPLLRPLGLTSQAEKTALNQLYGTKERPSGMVKKYGEEISKIGESKAEKLKSKIPEISKSQRATYNRVFESTGSKEKARKAAGF